MVCGFGVLYSKGTVGLSAIIDLLLLAILGPSVLTRFPSPPRRLKVTVMGLLARVSNYRSNFRSGRDIVKANFAFPRAGQFFLNPFSILR